MVVEFRCVAGENHHTVILTQGHSLAFDARLQEQQGALFFLQPLPRPGDAPGNHGYVALHEEYKLGYPQSDLVLD